MLLLNVTVLASTCIVPASGSRLQIDRHILCPLRSAGLFPGSTAASVLLRMNDAHWLAGLLARFQLLQERLLLTGTFGSPPFLSLAGWLASAGWLTHVLLREKVDGY